MDVETLLVALGGAAVGFLGTWLLQAQRHRREDRIVSQEQLGIAAAVRSELRVAESYLKPVLEDEEDAVIIPSFTRFSAAIWQAHAPRLLAALRDEEVISLGVAYNKLEVTNNLMASLSGTVSSAPLDLSRHREIREGLAVTEDAVAEGIRVLDAVTARLRSV